MHRRTARRRAGRLVGVVVAGLVGLLLPLGLAPTAQAATSTSAVVDDDGNFLARAEFNSGLHYYHQNWRPGPGVNSFQVVDRCDDGWTVHLTWSSGAENGSVTLSDDCLLFPVLRYHEVKTGHAPELPEEMDWYLYLENADGELAGNEIQEDWMGSYSYMGDSTYFIHSSVYVEDLTSGQKTLTASLTPTRDAYSTDDEEEAHTKTAVIWDELQARTPLPMLSTDQQWSMYKQLYCHVRFAVYTELPGVEGGGPTWDLEVERPDIPWDEVEDVTTHQCNWGGTPGHGYVPPTDGGEQQDNLAPMADAGPDRTGEEGSPVQLNGVVWDDGGQAAASWSYEPLDGVDEGAACTFGDTAAPSTTVTCTDDGRYRVMLTADDGANWPVSDSAVVTLENVAPTLDLGGTEDWAVYRAGESLDLGATFTDPGANDTHTCTVTWDDGTTDEYAATEGTCGQGHTFDDAGMYTMDVKVTDDDGGSDSAQVMVVVYDPDAGFVTGAGSALPEMAPGTTAETASATARFTFNPKYLPHDEGPPATGGKFVYQLTETGFELNADGFDWLVVTPDGKTAFRGTGTLDGASGYGFVAYATEDSEAFRVVVWDLDVSAHPDDDPLYDSVRGEGYDVDVASPAPITRGAIRIHPS